MTIRAYARLLTASRDDRTLKYRLLTWGEKGNTSAGLVTASAGSLEVPDEPLPVNLEHEYKAPLGTMSVEEVPEGLDATVTLANTTAGNDALEEAAAGLRAGISVELEQVRIRGGQLLAGVLTAAGLVVRPAFPSSVLTASAPDMGEEPDPNDSTDSADDTAGDDPTQEEEPVSKTTASTPAAGTAAHKLAAAAGVSAAPKTGVTADQLFASIAKGASQGSTVALTAALDNITQGDVFDKVAVPTYVGEIWSGRNYKQVVAPLFTSLPLDAVDYIGWRWTAGKTPGVFDYAGSLAEVTSNEVTAEPVKYTASRVASAHKLDRVHVDLPNEAFWESFYRERADNYARIVDRKSIDHLLKQTTAGTYDNATKVSMAAGTTPFRALIRGARKVLLYGAPAYAIVGNDLYEDLLDTVDMDKLAFLSMSLGLEEGALEGFKIIGAPEDKPEFNGKVCVSAQGVNEKRELPGGPIRVDALDIAKGGVDAGLFGYLGFHTNSTAGNVIVEVG